MAKSQHSYLVLKALIIIVAIVGAGIYWFLAQNPAPETAKHTIEKGAEVDLTGMVSNMPWQHMIDQREGYPEVTYIDFDNDQMVVYSKEAVNCDGHVRIKGTVIQIEGTSKRPGSDELYTELQIEADEIKCYQNLEVDN